MTVDEDGHGRGVRTSQTFFVKNNTVYNLEIDIDVNELAIKNRQ